MTTPPATTRFEEPSAPLTDAYGLIADRINAFPLRRGFGWPWLAAFGAASALLMLGLVSVAWLLLRGVGVWGINVPVAWGFAIVNFVWWIGIGHAGTLISAIFLLARQRWRTSINRFAEAMTLFAVANAGLFPLLHLGRIWKFYYLLPYPGTMGLWPQWRSPLIFDVFAVMTYSLVSFLFWYVGLIPDLATLRDGAPRKWARVCYGVLAMGWRGSARHWRRYQMLYLLLAGLATPLVVSVHSIVSFDFAVALVPGWHSTIFPPYFVAGAIYSGFAMVLTLLIPMRAAFGFKGFITTRHLDVMGKVMLTAGLIVAYGYFLETFTAWFSGDEFERALIHHRALGPHAGAFWALMVCNVAAGQALWLRRVRRNAIALFVVAVAVNVGMWLERYVIVIISLSRDFVPSAWGSFTPTFWDWSLFMGSLGFFSALMLLFLRLLPSIAVFEMRELLHERANEREHGERDGARDEEALDEKESGETLSRPFDLSEPFRSPPDEPILHGVIPDDALYGVMGEFEDDRTLLAAARRARDAGHRHVDAYTPFPLASLPEALDLPKTRMPRVVLAGALVGAVSAYLLQWYSAVIDYPLNVGGRPDHSWPSFIPLTFELAVLGGALFGVVGMLAINRFPQPYHPAANAPGFSRATRDRFFLCIEKTDPLFDRARCRALLEAGGAVQVSEVPA